MYRSSGYTIKHVSDFDDPFNTSLIINGYTLSAAYDQLPANKVRNHEL